MEDPARHGGARPQVGGWVSFGAGLGLGSSGLRGRSSVAWRSAATGGGLGCGLYQEPPHQTHPNPNHPFTYPPTQPPPPPPSLDSIKKSIESRKPDFDAYIDPQKKHADMIIQVGGRGGGWTLFGGAGVWFRGGGVCGGVCLFKLKRNPHLAILRAHARTPAMAAAPLENTPAAPLHPPGAAHPAGAGR